LYLFEAVKKKLSSQNEAVRYIQLTRMMHHCQKNGGHDVYIRDLVLLDAREEKVGLELGHDDNRNRNQKVVVDGLDRA
jgi:hypothetical protein